MRIYLPVTSTDLRHLVQHARIGGAASVAFAVTPELRQWCRAAEAGGDPVDRPARKSASGAIPGDADDEEALEYVAMNEAARTCLHLLAADASAARRRIVVAADLEAADVADTDITDLRLHGAVRITRPVAAADIASVHVDDRDAERAVAAAASCIVTAELGDPAAQTAVDGVEAHELSWYASQEVAVLLADL